MTSGGEQFKDHPTALKGNNDLLSITRPDIIKEIHREYFLAGADIAETNSFGATSIAQEDYQLGEYAYDISKAAASIAREVADEITEKQPHKPRFVAGSIGPTTRLASMSPDVNDPGNRNVTFDELVEAFKTQTMGLIDGGSDMLLVETITDTLNAKAALYAIEGGAGSLQVRITNNDIRNNYRCFRQNTLRTNNRGFSNLNLTL